MATQTDPMEELARAESALTTAMDLRETGTYLLEQARAAGDARGAAAAQAALKKAESEEMAAKATIKKSNEILQANAEYKAQKQGALDQLASGSFRVTTPQSTSFSMGEIPTETQFTELSPTRKNAEALISQALDVPIDKVDLSSGLTAGDRAILQAIPTDEERKAALEGKYGQENVSALNIDGKNTLLIRKGDGTIIPVDEMGASIADLVDFGVGVGIEAPKIAAATGAAILTAPSIAGSAAAGSAAYSGVGAMQDQLVRAALNMPQRGLETLQRRGMEAGIGALTDVATLGTGKYVAGRMAKPVRNQMMDGLTKAQQTLAREGIQTEVPMAAAFGQQSLAEAHEAAGKHPSSGLARRMKRSQEAIVDFMQGLVKREFPKDSYENLVKGFKQEIESISAEIAGRDTKSRRIVEGFIERRANDARMAREDRSKVGQMLADTLNDAKQVETDLQTQAFQGIYDEADKAGFQVKPEELANFIRRKQLNTRGMPIENKESDEIIQMLYGSDEALFQAKQLRDMAAKDPMLAQDESIALKIAELEKKAAPKGLADLHSFRQQLADKIVDGGAPGAGVSSNTAKKLTAYMNEFMDEKLRKFDPNLADRWIQTNADFDNKLAFGRGSVGRILRQKLGDNAISPEAMAKVAIESKTNATDILTTLQRYDQEAGTNVASEVKSYLQAAYLDKIGLTKQKGIAPKPVMYDVEIMDALFGNGSTGSGKIYADKLDRLNMALADARINPSGVRKEQVSQLFQSLDQQTERSIIKQIVAKEKAEEAKSRLVSSRVMQLVKQPGGVDKIQTDHLATAMLDHSTRISEVAKTYRRMSASEREQLKQDFVQDFFGRYSNGDRTQTSSYYQLWDASAFLNDVGRNPNNATKEGMAYAKKLSTILGQDFYEKLHAASMMAEANLITTKGGTSPLRVVAKPDKKTGVSGALYLAGNIVDGTKGKVLSILYGQKMLDPIMDAMARAGGEAETERLVNKAFARIITSSKGLQAIGMEATKDPEFAVDIADYMNRIAEIEDKYSQK